MIASYPLHKASLSFPRRGEKAQSVSEKIPHWPSPLLLLTGPTPPPPSSVKVSSPPLRSLGFFPLSLALTSPSGCDLCSLSHLPLFFPLSPPPLYLCLPLPHPFLSSSPAARNFSIWSPTCASLHSLTLPAHRHNYPMATNLSPFYGIWHTLSLLVNRQ